MQKLCLAVTNTGSAQNMKPVQTYKCFRFSVFMRLLHVNFNKAFDLHQHVCFLPSKTECKQGNDTFSVSIL